MEVLTKEEFFERTMGGRPNQMKTDIYIGKKFECGCGECHEFLNYKHEVLRELKGMRLVIKAKDCGFVNCVKIKGIFKPKFVTQFSTKD